MKLLDTFPVLSPENYLNKHFLVKMYKRKIVILLNEKQKPYEPRIGKRTENRGSGKIGSLRHLCFGCFRPIKKIKCEL